MPIRIIHICSFSNYKTTLLYLHKYSTTSIHVSSPPVTVPVHSDLIRQSWRQDAAPPMMPTHESRPASGISVAPSHPPPSPANSSVFSVLVLPAKGILLVGSIQSWKAHHEDSSSMLLAGRDLGSPAPRRNPSSPRGPPRRCLRARQQFVHRPENLQRPTPTPHHSQSRQCRLGETPRQRPRHPKPEAANRRPQRRHPDVALWRGRHPASL